MKPWKRLLYVAFVITIGLSVPTLVGRWYQPQISEASILFLLVDTNCVQESFDPNQSPFPIDPNQVVGALLPPMQITAGMLNRVGTYCDPEGDPVTIRLVGGSTDFTIDVNDLTNQWTLAGELDVGVHYLVIQAADHPVNAESAEALATLVVEVSPRPNAPPILY